MATLGWVVGHWEERSTNSGKSILYIFLISSLTLVASKSGSEETGLSTDFFTVLVGRIDCRSN